MRRGSYLELKGTYALLSLWTEIVLKVQRIAYPSDLFRLVQSYVLEMMFTVTKMEEEADYPVGRSGGTGERISDGEKDVTSARQTVP